MGRLKRGQCWPAAAPPERLLWLLLLALLQLGSASPQEKQTIAGFQTQMAQMLQVFNGNESAASQQQARPQSAQFPALAQDQNHFKLLERELDFLLVGARNVVYNLSLSTMREQRRLEWPSSEEDVKMCRVKGKSTEQCQNYIRVLKLKTPDTLYVCGTNAYKPRCRTYLITNNAYELLSEAPGEGACPYQENQNVSSLVVDGSLYSATAAQFSGIDGLIHRPPLRTEQFNPKQLNSPNFVSSFRYGEHVYFLFRESAIEHINCGKTIYSRIARVCINDAGGPTRASRERWTSFVKARLNCSIPGEFPFYFDEIQASTQIVGPPTSAFYGHHSEAAGSGRQASQDLLYAVFTTPANSIGGSAVCAFRMSDVLAAFEGPFKSQADSNSNWLPVPESRVPSPRPGTCVNDSKRLPDENINFIKDNPLMDTAVEAVWSQPLIMMASINFRFTQIAVDAQVETAGALGASSMRADVIFVSTDDGRVFKLTNNYNLLARQQQHQFGQQLLQPEPFYMARPAHEPHRQPQAAQLLAGAGPKLQREPLADVSASTIVIEELHLFDANTPIVNMQIYYPSSPAAGQYPKLVVLASRQLKAVPLSRCERALTCADCLALYDPYCAWDARAQLCQSVGRSALSPLEQTGSRSSHLGWFPPNGLLNNHTLAWWLQCPLLEGESPAQQQVGAPFRSLFSSHLQVPNRFDYASGHHLSHTALVSLSTPAQPNQPQQPPASQFRQQPASECLTYCGGLYTPQLSAPASAASSPAGDPSQQLMVNCADYVQQHYIGSAAGSLQLQTGANGNLYTSENLILAVIICAVSGMLLGLLFGFALGRNARKHDSSICSSTFDENNLYMASTGSHHGNLFAQHQRQLNHPLLHASLQPDANPAGLLTGLRAGAGSALTQGQLLHGHAYETCEGQQQAAKSKEQGAAASHQEPYSSTTQAMLLHLASSVSGPNQAAQGNNTSARNTALPPLPTSSPPSHLSAPLINTSAQANNQNSITHITPSQLTPNSLAGANNHQLASAGSTSSGSTTNTSNTSATIPANDHHNQLYLNQQQLLLNVANQHHQQQNIHQAQRSFGSTNTAAAAGTKSSINVNKLQNNATLKNQSYLQQQYL